MKAPPLVSWIRMGGFGLMVLWVKGSPQWGLSILLWNQTNACSKLKHLACLMAACLPRKVPRHTRPQAPWPRTSPNLGMGGGCAQGKWVGKCALWLWLWPWQPKPCPVRTTARSKSSKAFPFPLTEETHTEGPTSKNLASLPREARPEGNDFAHNCMRGPTNPSLRGLSKRSFGRPQYPAASTDTFDLRNPCLFQTHVNWPCGTVWAPRGQASSSHRPLVFAPSLSRDALHVSSGPETRQKKLDGALPQTILLSFERQGRHCCTTKAKNTHGLLSQHRKMSFEKVWRRTSLCVAHSRIPTNGSDPSRAFHPSVCAVLTHACTGQWKNTCNEA